MIRSIYFDKIFDILLLRSLKHPPKFVLSMRYVSLHNPDPLPLQLTNIYNIYNMPPHTSPDTFKTLI